MSPAPTCTNDAGLGGGDDSIDVSSGGYLYVSSLWLGNVTMSVSTNGGFAPWQVNPAAANLPSDDRQWVAAYGPQTVYMSYAHVEGSSGVSLIVAKSTDAGKTFSQVTPVTLPTDPVQSEVQGNLVVDKYNGNVYTVFVPQAINGHAHNEIYIARSTDGGATFTEKLASKGPANTDNIQVFPTMAVDRGGNLHIAFSRCLITVVGTVTHRSQCQIYLVSSTDAGQCRVRHR